MKLYYLVLICAFFAKAAFAGSQQPQTAQLPAKAISIFAKKVEKYAASQGARAFILARRGQAKSELPKGIHYTHSALAIYSNITLENGEIAKGYAIYNLYQDSERKDKSALVTDYPVDFFWAVPELTTGIIIPSYELQTRLVEAIEQGNHSLLHNPNYSLISNPFSNEYQNCNEHLLDVVNSAIYSTTEQAQIKANTKAYFKPQRVHMSRAKLALGSFFTEGVTTKDHGRKIFTTTFTSIARYLSSYGLTQSVVEINAHGDVKEMAL